MLIQIFSCNMLLQKWKDPIPLEHHATQVDEYISVDLLFISDETSVLVRRTFT